MSPCLATNIYLKSTKILHTESSCYFREELSGVSFFLSFFFCTMFSIGMYSHITYIIANMIIVYIFFLFFKVLLVYDCVFAFIMLLLYWDTL
jgi:hypothetical protein